MISEDIAKLTGLSISCINKILQLEQDCICYAVQEALIDKRKYVDINIGIGILSLNIGEEELQYKFIPSQSLENDIITTTKNKQAPIIRNLENNIKNKILNAYKELL